MKRTSSISAALILSLPATATALTCGYIKGDHTPPYDLAPVDATYSVAERRLSYLASEHRLTVASLPDQPSMHFELSELLFDANGEGWVNQVLFEQIPEGTFLVIWSGSDTGISELAAFHEFEDLTAGIFCEGELTG